MNQNPPQLTDLDLIEQVGTGGMATVWKAFDRQRNIIVAVKILNAKEAYNIDDLKLFVAEEKAMEDLHHQGIVRGIELRRDQGVWYYIMEFVDGYNFGALLQRKQHLHEIDCLLICESVAAALQYAWESHAVVHCDLKPENIMINTEGIVKLTDLGLCHTFRFLNNDQLKVPDHVLGTPAYISPEQIYGDVELDCRADIYSLGATLYHLSTGRVLFPGYDNEAMLRAHCSETVQAQDPRVYRPDLSQGFCQLLEAMLVKNRDYRLGTWGDVMTMCLETEKGMVFDPRTTPAVSTLKLNA